MDYKPALEAYFQDKQELLERYVCRLAAIPSVKGEPAPGAPFGPEVARCLDQALAIADQLGLHAHNYDGYVGTVDLNDKPDAVHILGHLDVVAAGEGWTVTEPYQPVAKAGLLYGRGVADDKGPMAAALLAMAAVKQLGIPLKQNAKLILGTDEESGSADIAYYYAREPYAPCCFSPDADFPVIHIEKGSYKPTFTRRWPPQNALPRVTRLSGGLRINVLPGDAAAEVAGLDAAAVAGQAGRTAAATGVRFDLEDTPQGVRIAAKGVGAHAASPQEGNNAITALLELLCALPLAPGAATDALSALHALFPHGDTAGHALGIAQADEASGALTLAFSLLEVGEEGLEGRFDSRTPLCATADNCQKVAEAAFARYGISCTGEMGSAHHTPEDSPFVQTLLGCYEEVTGLPGQCIAIGGATYVHDIPGGVAFGPCMPGVQTNMHGPDERVSVSDLLTAAKIYALAIARLCG